MWYGYVLMLVIEIEFVCLIFYVGEDCEGDDESVGGGLVGDS